MKRTSTATGFRFFNFSFEYLKDFKVLNLFIQKSNLLLVRIRVCRESFLPIGGRTFICCKIPPKCCTILVWIAECWNTSNNLYSRAVIKRTIFVFPAFLKHSLAVRQKRSRFVPKQTVIRTSRRLNSFLSEVAQNFEVFSKIQK